MTWNIYYTCSRSPILVTNTILLCINTVAMSSYDPVPVTEAEIISPEQFRQSMKLVRLQIAIPISVLIAMGANLICALAIKPGLSGCSPNYILSIDPRDILS